MKRLQKISTKNIVFVFFSSILLVMYSNAQSNPPPTPLGIISIQGNDNTGDIQPYTMEQIINRTGIFTWHQANWTGQGQRIGILDQGFGGIDDFETANSVSVIFQQNRTEQEINEDSITHGTNVLTIIHSIAPDAQFYVCSYLSFAQLALCIDWMVASGVNIINHSAGVPALPLDGTGQWASEVDRAVREGILWVNAAGNFADGYISDFFNDNNLNTYHEFRGSGIIETLAINSINETVGRIMLSWEGTDDRSANEIDLDLEIIDISQNIIATSANKQTGQSSQVALEVAQIDMSQPFGVRVRNTDSNGSEVHFVLFIEFASLPSGLSSQSIITPGDSINALTVGALQGNSIAPYSSRGPIATGAIKPDLVAPGEIILPNDRSFVGTSAAAPIVAGVAALVWEAHSDWSQYQVQQFILDSVQDDSQIPGADSNYGQGRLYLPLPQSLTPTEIPTSTSSITIREFNSVEMVLVPDGCFMMGYMGGKADEQPAYQICFDTPFWIDRYEVSNGQFNRLNGQAVKSSYWTADNFPREEITWYEAQDFCILRGARLPTEAEWEYTARGPNSLLYPWGNSFEGTKVNYCDSNCPHPWKDENSNDGYSTTAPVNAFGAGISWVGAFQMSGNVYEWVSSSYAPYPYTANDGREVMGSRSGETSIWRGGSWVNGEADTRASLRIITSAGNSDNAGGFRCARDYGK